MLNQISKLGKVIVKLFKNTCRPYYMNTMYIKNFMFLPHRTTYCLSLVFVLLQFGFCFPPSIQRIINQQVYRSDITKSMQCFYYDFYPFQNEIFDSGSFYEPAQFITNISIVKNIPIQGYYY